MRPRRVAGDTTKGGQLLPSLRKPWHAVGVRRLASLLPPRTPPISSLPECGVPPLGWAADGAVELAP